MNKQILIVLSLLTTGSAFAFKPMQSNNISNESQAGYLHPENSGYQKESVSLQQRTLPKQNEQVYQGDNDHNHDHNQEESSSTHKSDGKSYDKACISKGGEYLIEIDRLVDESNGDKTKAQELIKQSQLWLDSEPEGKSNIAELVFKSIENSEKRSEYKKIFAKTVMSFCER